MFDGVGPFWSANSLGNEEWWPWRGTHAGFNQSMVDATLVNTYPMPIDENELFPSLVDDSANDTFYAPEVTQFSADQNLIADLVVDADAFYAPDVAFNPTPALVNHDDTFYAPTVTAGQVELLPELVEDADTFFAPSVANVSNVDPDLVVDGDTFFSPTVTVGAVTLLPGLVDHDDTFFAPTVSAGAIELLPGLVTDDDTFFAPTVEPGAVTLTPDLVVDTDTFYAALISEGLTLLPGLVANDDTFHTPVVTRGAITLLPPLVEDTDTVFAPSVATGAFAVFPDRAIDTEAFYAPTVTFSNVILPPLFVHPLESFYAPSGFGHALLPGTPVDADTFYSAVITTGPVSIFPPLVTSADVIYVPAVQRQGNQGGGGGGGGGGGTVPKDIKYATAITMAAPGLITALGFTSDDTRTVNTRMAIYANSGSNPGARLGVTESHTNVTIGSNVYTLQVPVSVLTGQVVWIALQSDGNNFQWFLVNAPQGSRFNNDLFSDGIADPFGTASNDNKKAPIFAIFLEQATATITPDKHNSDDTFHAPVVSKADYELLLSFVVEDDAVWPPSVVTVYELLPGAVAQDDAVHTPAVTAADWDIEPGLVVDADVFHSPFVGIEVGDDQATFGADFPADDVFYAPTVEPQGGVLEPPLVVDTDVIFAVDELSYKDVLIDDFLNDADVIPSPTVLSTIEIFPDLVIDQDIPMEPPEVTVEVAGQELFPTLVIDGDVISALMAGRPGRNRAAILAERRSAATVLGERDDQATIDGTIVREVEIEGST